MIRGRIGLLLAALTRSTPAFTGQTSADGGQLVMPVKRLDTSLPLPRYAHEGDAGMDLMAAEEVHLPAGQWKLVRTGLAIAVPTGCVGLVHPRSGMASRFGVTVLNAPGTVDSGYRGEVKVNLINHSRHHVTIERGDRIAQLLIQRVERVWLHEMPMLETTERGEGGHGSTGMRS